MRSRIRSQSGFTLVEALVALLLGAMYCLALLQVCVETMRVTTTNSNKQAADLIAQTVLDAFKAAPYYVPGQTKPPTVLAIPPGSYDLLVVSTAPGQIAPQPTAHPLPASLNLGDLNWVGTINNKFPGSGTVQLVVINGPDQATPSQTATVTVIWSDSIASNKSVATMTVVHARGTNFWH